MTHLRNNLKSKIKFKQQDDEKYKDEYMICLHLKYYDLMNLLQFMIVDTVTEDTVVQTMKRDFENQRNVGIIGKFEKII